MNRLILGTRFCFLILIVIASIISIVPWGFSSIALAEQVKQELQPNEIWVLGQLKHGNVADLRKYSNGEDRVLSADFLEQLLTGELEDAHIHRHGVNIKYAIFTESIDLVSAQVHFDTLLTYCRFENDVDLSKSHFQAFLSFANSTFSNADAKASFYCMTVGNNANFSDTVFEGPVDFDSAKIGGVFIANGANFTNADEEANFQSMRVEETALYHDAVFAGPVDFGYSQIGINFEAARAKFKGPSHFSSVTVGYRANFSDASFNGTAKFDFVKIGGDFVANGANFTYERWAATFWTMKVEGTALYNNAVFKGPVDFSYSRIGRNFEAQEAEFERSLYFVWVTVENKANFNDASFNGTVDFGYSQIGGNFDAVSADFLNSEDGAKFNSMTVGYRANFSDAIFKGPVDFDFVKIGGDFVTNGANFTYADGEANFRVMKVEGTALYNNAVFKGPVNFSYSQIGRNFETQRAEFEDSVDFVSVTVGNKANFKDASFNGSANFSYSQIGSNFDAVSADFLNSEDGANFNSMTVGNRANFKDASFNGTVDFRLAEFQNLIISIDEELCQTKNLHGMTYKRISIAGESSLEDLLAWVDVSEYSTQPYVQLETFFAAEGDLEHADAVFAAQKRQERKRMSKWYAWLDLILDWTTLYGRSPQRLFWGIPIFIFFGILVFRRREGMEQQERYDQHRAYNPFWYSLDLFIPFVNLGMASAWMPRKNRRFAQTYAKMQTVYGWALMPIALASITAIIT